MSTFIAVWFVVMSYAPTGEVIEYFPVADVQSCAKMEYVLTRQYEGYDFECRYALQPVVAI